MNDLIDTIETNINTNLFKHPKKRLREFLRMNTYERNRIEPAVVR